MKEFKMKMFRSVIATFFALTLVFVPIMSVMAAEEDEVVTSPSGAKYTNPSTGYGVYIDDTADLLNDSEEQELIKIMTPVTEYGHAIYLTTEAHTFQTTGAYVEDYYLSNFGAYKSGIVLCIDNDLEYDYVYSEGKIYDTVGKSFADTITDNIYRYSMKEQWFQGASVAFDQIYKVLEGKRIAQPMKYICNTFLGLLIALMINFLIVNNKSKLKGVSTTEMVEGSLKQVQFNGVSTQFINQSRVYSPRSSSSSGGGSHGGGGHHGGGGGHHGGGGGHSH